MSVIGANSTIRSLISTHTHTYIVYTKYIQTYIVYTDVHSIYMVYRDRHRPSIYIQTYIRRVLLTVLDDAAAAAAAVLPLPSDTVMIL